MKQTILLLFIISLSPKCFSQQFGRINNFWQVYARSNPAQTNSFDSLEVNLIGRAQDIGFPGAPSTLFANYNQIYTKIHGSFGFSSEYDEIGFNNSLNFKMNYTYRLETRIGDWAFGTNLGINFLGVGGDWIPPQTFQDASLPKFNQETFQIDLGVAYKLNNLRLGLGMVNYSLVLDNNPIVFNNAPHFTFNSAYHLKFSDKWSSDVFFQFLTDTKYYTPDLGILFSYTKSLNFGIIVHNFDGFESIYYGLTAGYNHKSGIGIYSSFVIGGVYYKNYLNRPNIEIGLRFRRKSL
jgi:hypothetical protein